MSATPGPHAALDLHENCVAITGAVPVSAGCPADQRQYYQRIGMATQRDPHPVYGGGIDHATMMANARLWAAASGLLEALRGLADDISERFDMGCPSTNPGIKSAIAAARAAISKAGAA